MTARPRTPLTPDDRRILVVLFDIWAHPVHAGAVRGWLTAAEVSERSEVVSEDGRPQPVTPAEAQGPLGRLVDAGLAGSDGDGRYWITDAGRREVRT